MAASEHWLRLTPRTSGRGNVVAREDGWLLRIPAGPKSEYRLAQIDDYGALPRRDFPWRAPMELSLKARISPGVRAGTWGFGLWNDSLGMAVDPLQGRIVLPTTPQAAWYFWAAPSSYLSLRDDLPANGFLAQTFSSERIGLGLPAIGLALAIRRAAARRILRRYVREDSLRVETQASEWHHYLIRWESDSVRFAMDGRQLLSTTVAPTGRLGVVIWIDNQFAAFEPSGRTAWGFEESHSEGSLEISEVRAETGV